MTSKARNTGRAVCNIPTPALFKTPSDGSLLMIPYSGILDAASAGSRYHVDCRVDSGALRGTMGACPESFRLPPPPGSFWAVARINRNYYVSLYNNNAKSATRQHNGSRPVSGPGEADRCPHHSIAVGRADQRLRSVDAERNNGANSVPSPAPLPAWSPGALASPGALGRAARPPPADRAAAAERARRHLPVVLERSLWLDPAAQRRSQHRFSGLSRSLEQLPGRLARIVVVSRTNARNCASRSTRTPGLIAHPSSKNYQYGYFS
jgi:hypothetical protein